MIFAHLPIDPARFPVCPATGAWAASVDRRMPDRATA